MRERLKAILKASSKSPREIIARYEPKQKPLASQIVEEIEYSMKTY